MLQRCLNIDNYLVGSKCVIAIDRAVVVIIGIIRIVTPGRIPPAVIPTPKPPTNKTMASQ